MKTCCSLHSSKHHQIMFLKSIEQFLQESGVNCRQHFFAVRIVTVRNSLRDGSCFSLLIIIVYKASKSCRFEWLSYGEIVVFTIHVVIIVSVSLEVSGGLFVLLFRTDQLCYGMYLSCQLCFYTVCSYMLASCKWPVALRWP